MFDRMLRHLLGESPGVNEKRDKVKSSGRSRRKRQKSHIQWAAEMGHKRNLKKARWDSALPARKKAQRMIRPKKAKAFRNR